MVCAEDSQMRFDAARSYKAHLDSVASDRGLEEYLQDRGSLVHACLG